MKKTKGLLATVMNKHAKLIEGFRILFRVAMMLSLWMIDLLSSSNWFSKISVFIRREFLRVNRKTLKNKRG